MPVSRQALRHGALLLLALAGAYPFLLALHGVLFSYSPRTARAALAGRIAPAPKPAPRPEPPAVYRWLPPDTRTVVTLRPRQAFDSPLAVKHTMDRLRDSVFYGFRLGDVDTVVIGLPDQENLDRAFVVVEGIINAADLEQRLRARNPGLVRHAEGGVTVLEMPDPPERLLGIGVGGRVFLAPLDNRTCLISLGDRETLTARLNPTQPLPAELAAALAERSTQEQASLVMLPPFMQSLRQKLDLNPVLQWFPHLRNEAFDPPEKAKDNLTGLLQISAWLTVTDHFDGEMRSVSEREADAEKFRKNLEYSLSMVRKAAQGQMGVGGVAEMDAFLRSLEVVSEGKVTVVRKKVAR